MWGRTIMEDSNQNPNQEEKSFFVRSVWLAPVFYLFFIGALIALGMLYIHRENMVNRNSIKPDIAIDSTFFRPIASTPPAPPSTSLGPNVGVTSLLNPSKAQIENGEKLFKMDCAPCHGLNGKGDGPAAASLNPKPRDYHATTGWVNGRLLSEMFKTVSEGIPGSAMVSFAAALSSSDRLDIIDYIRATFGNFPKDTPAQLEAMIKTYHLAAPASASSNGPAAPIPVAQAMKTIEESGVQRAREAETAASYISQDSASAGAKLFRSIVLDRRRALTVLTMSSTWSKSMSDFVTVLTSNAVQNGFDPKVAQLSNKDWQTLYNYLKNVFSNKVLASSND